MASIRLIRRRGWHACGPRTPCFMLQPVFLTMRRHQHPHSAGLPSPVALSGEEPLPPAPAIRDQTSAIRLVMMIATNVTGSVCSPRPWRGCLVSSRESIRRRAHRRRTGQASAGDAILRLFERRIDHGGCPTVASASPLMTKPSHCRGMPLASPSATHATMAARVIAASTRTRQPGRPPLCQARQHVRDGQGEKVEAYTSTDQANGQRILDKPPAERWCVQQSGTHTHGETRPMPESDVKKINEKAGRMVKTPPRYGQGHCRAISEPLRFIGTGHGNEINGLVIGFSLSRPWRQVFVHRPCFLFELRSNPPRAATSWRHPMKDRRDRRNDGRWWGMCELGRHLIFGLKMFVINTVNAKRAFLHDTFRRVHFAGTIERAERKDRTRCTSPH